jgi:hypothetical protein
MHAVAETCPASAHAQTAATASPRAVRMSSLKCCLQGEGSAWLAALLAAHHHGDIHDRRRSEEREEPSDHRLVDDDHEGGSAEAAGQQTRSWPGLAVRSARCGRAERRRTRRWSRGNPRGQGSARPPVVPGHDADLPAGSPLTRPGSLFWLRRFVRVGAEEPGARRMSRQPRRRDDEYVGFPVRQAAEMAADGHRAAAGAVPGPSPRPHRRPS